MKPAATHWLPPATLCKPQVFVAAIDAGLEAVSRLLRTVRVAAHCPTPPRSPRRSALVAPGDGVVVAEATAAHPASEPAAGVCCGSLPDDWQPLVAAPQSCWFCIPDRCVTIHLQAKWKGKTTAVAVALSARLSPCRSGGIGRRAWFRSMYSQGCGGSSPFFGTKNQAIFQYIW